jgi:hypothetical protein
MTQIGAHHGRHRLTCRLRQMGGAASGPWNAVDGILGTHGHQGKRLPPGAPFARITLIR